MVSQQHVYLFHRSDTAAAFNVSLGDVHVTGVEQVRPLYLSEIKQILAFCQK